MNTDDINIVFGGDGIIDTITHTEINGVPKDNSTSIKPDTVPIISSNISDSTRSLPVHQNISQALNDIKELKKDVLKLDRTTAHMQASLARIDIMEGQMKQLLNNQQIIQQYIETIRDKLSMISINSTPVQGSNGYVTHRVSVTGPSQLFTNNTQTQGEMSTQSIPSPHISPDIHMNGPTVTSAISSTGGMYSRNMEQYTEPRINNDIFNEQYSQPGSIEHNYVDDSDSDDISERGNDHNLRTIPIHTVTAGDPARRQALYGKLYRNRTGVYVSFIYLMMNQILNEAREYNNRINPISGVHYLYNINHKSMYDKLMIICSSLTRSKVYGLTTLAKYNSHTLNAMKAKMVRADPTDVIALTADTVESYTHTSDGSSFIDTCKLFIKLLRYYGIFLDQLTYNVLFNIDDSLIKRLPNPRTSIIPGQLIKEVYAYNIDLSRVIPTPSNPTDDKIENLRSKEIEMLIANSVKRNTKIYDDAVRYVNSRR